MFVPFHPTRAHFVLLLSLATVAVAGTAFVGWAAEVHLLRSFVPGYPAMRPLSALGFVLLAFGLAATVLRPENLLLRLAPAALGSIVTFGGVAALFVSLRRVAGADEGFEPPVVSFLIEAGRPDVSPVVPVIFILLGVSLMLAKMPNSRHRPEVVPITALAVTFAVVLGQLYHADAPFLFANADRVALPTTFLAALMACGLIVRNAHSSLTRLLGSDSLGGAAARRLVPAVVVIPTVIGWLRVQGQELGFYNTGLGSAMSTFTLVLLMIAIVFFYSRAVHSSDRSRRRAEADLKDKEMRYRELFDYSQGLICIHDIHGRLTTVNRAARHLLGYAEEEMVGTNLRDFAPEDQRPAFDIYLRQVTNEGLANGLMELRSKTGKRIVLRYNNVLATEEGREPYVLGHAQDVTELLEAQQELKNLSLTDELTGLYNRRGFATLAEQQLKLEMHNGTARGLTLLFLDMDGLKAINDTYGHEAGSLAIVTLSRLLRSAVRSADIVSRWGGDEFVILSIGAKDENTQLMVDRIHERLDEYNAESKDPYLIACSIGVAPIDLDSPLTFDEIVAQADAAMYADKKRRKAARGDISDPPQSFVRPWIGHSTRV